MAVYAVGSLAFGRSGLADLVAEALEAADVAARAAPGALALLVVADAEVAVPGLGSDRRAWVMTSWSLMMVPSAFFFGMRVHRRRYLAPRKVWVRPAPAAASPRVPPM